MDAASVEVIRAEGRVARREVDLHSLGVAAAACGCRQWCARPRAVFTPRRAAVRKRPVCAMATL